VERQISVSAGAFFGTFFKTLPPDAEQYSLTASLEQKKKKSIFIFIQKVKQ